ncbi:MAG: hypothetical protein ACRDSL_02525 [Pseudonocardiaceae bacterium]
MPDVDKLLDADSLIEELEELHERRDVAIEVRVDELNEVALSVDEIAFELDNQLAEYDYVMVNQSIDIAIDAIEHTDDGQLEELVRLASVEIPGDTGGPVGTQDQLPPLPHMRVAELPSAEGVDWERERDAVDYAEAVRHRVAVCADRIRYLLDYFSEELWTHIVAAAKRADSENALAALTECGTVANELRDAHGLWMLWLNELYLDDPANLGYVGEVTAQTVILAGRTARSR